MWKPTQVFHIDTKVDKSGVFRPDKLLGLGGENFEIRTVKVLLNVVFGSYTRSLPNYLILVVLNLDISGIIGAPKTSSLH